MRLFKSLLMSLHFEDEGDMSVRKWSPYFHMCRKRSQYLAFILVGAVFVYYHAGLVVRITGVETEASRHHETVEAESRPSLSSSVNKRPWKSKMGSRRGKRKGIFSNASDELVALIYALTTNPDCRLVQDDASSPLNPDNLLDFHLSAPSNTSSEFATFRADVYNRNPLVLVGNRNQWATVQLENMFWELGLADALTLVDTAGREDEATLSAVLTHLTGMETQPIALLHGEAMGLHEDLVGQAYAGTLTERLRQAGLDAIEGDSYALGQIAGKWSPTKP